MARTGTRRFTRGALALTAGGLLAAATLAGPVSAGETYLEVDPSEITAGGNVTASMYCYTGEGGSIEVTWTRPGSDVVHPFEMTAEDGFMYMGSGPIGADGATADFVATFTARCNDLPANTDTVLVRVPAPTTTTAAPTTTTTGEATTTTVAATTTTQPAKAAPAATAVKAKPTYTG